MDANGALRELLALRSATPASSFLKLCLVLRLCPTGLIKGEDWRLLSLEGACREYGASYLQAYGYDPVPAHVMDGLEVIRQTRNEIDTRRWKEMRSKGKGGK